MDAPVTTLVTLPQTKTSLVVAGAPVGSTAPKAAAARPRALRNAMLTEQLYFCDSLRAIL